MVLLRFRLAKRQKSSNENVKIGLVIGFNSKN